MSKEIERIGYMYKNRMKSGVNRYSLVNPGELYMAQRREEETLALLRKFGLKDFSTLKILEIGCGRGSKLLEWLRWGAQPSLLYGNDLMEDFIEQAKKLLPASHFTTGSAHQMPYEDGFFDVVAQLTVFTSILDSELKKQIAAEMLRVLKPGGVVLWYDFRYPSPRNHDVKPICPEEIRNLFPECEIKGRYITLLPPIARRLAPVSFTACRILEKIPALCSHFVAVIKKSGHDV